MILQLHRKPLTEAISEALHGPVRVIFYVRRFDVDIGTLCVADASVVEALSPAGAADEWAARNESHAGDLLLVTAEGHPGSCCFELAPIDERLEAFAIDPGSLGLC